MTSCLMKVWRNPICDLFYVCLVRILVLHTIAQLMRKSILYTLVVLVLIVAIVTVGVLDTQDLAAGIIH